MSGSAVCSVALFFRFFRKHNTLLQSDPCQFTLPPSAKQGSLFSTPCPAFLVFTLYEDGPSDWWEVLIFITRLFGWQKRTYAFFLNIFRKNAYAFFAKWIIGKVQLLFMCFNCESNLPLEIPLLQFCFAFKSFSMTFLKIFFDDRYHWQPCRFENCSAPEVDFSTFGGGGGTGHKTAALLQALLWFRGQGEPLVRSSSLLEIRVACACGKT